MHLSDEPKISPVGEQKNSFCEIDLTPTYFVC